MSYSEIAACKSLFLEQRVRSEWNLAFEVWFFFVFFLVLLEAVSSMDRKVLEQTKTLEPDSKTLKQVAIWAWPCTVYKQGCSSWGHWAQVAHITPYVKY